MNAIAKVFTFIGHSILEDIGIPVSLKNVLHTHANSGSRFDGTPAKNISAHSVIQWERWSEGDVFSYPRRSKGELLGWGYHNSSYGSYTESVPELCDLVRCDVKNDWHCDIGDVDGFCSSKSNLRRFKSIAEMVMTDSEKLINPVCVELLEENLCHHGIEITRPNNTSDYFACHSWDGRIFLMNTDGSHHFGAAQYLAAQLRKRIDVQGRLFFYYFNSVAVEQLLEKYNVFAFEFTSQGINEFQEAMRRYRANFLSTYLPIPFNHQKAILLPKSHFRSCKVAALLEEYGIFNLGNYFRSEANNSKRMGY